MSSADVKRLILSTIESTGAAECTSDFFDQAFPAPERPSAPEMMETITGLLDGSLKNPRAVLPSVEEQVADFCARNRLEFYEDKCRMDPRYWFRRRRDENV